MKKGDRIYYTGDMANGSSMGTITACNPATDYIPESVDIEYDEPRFEGNPKIGSGHYRPGSKDYGWASFRYLDTGRLVIKRNRQIEGRLDTRNQLVETDPLSRS